MCDRSEAKLSRKTSAGMTLNRLRHTTATSDVFIPTKGGVHREAKEHPVCSRV